MSITLLLNLAGSMGGLLVGICFSFSVAIFLLYLSNEQISKVASTPTLLTPPIQLMRTPTMVITSTQNDLLDLAETELESGNPERVEELLGPLIDNWILVDDKIRGYRLLGDSELRQGHPQLAASYFEKLYFFETTAENLLLLAMAYDTGGNIRRALEKYQELMSLEDLPPEIDRKMINRRIEEIERTLGTSVPTPTSITSKDLLPLPG